MKRYLRIEFERAFRSRTFWLSLFIGCTITVSQYVIFVIPCTEYLDVYLNNPYGSLCPHSWYEKWIGGELVSPQAYLFFLLLPVLASMPYSYSLANDRRTGYTGQIFTRVKKSKYYYAKYIVTFVSGGLTIILPLLLNLYLSLCTLPSIMPDRSTGTSYITGNKMWSMFYFNHPNLYILLYMLIIFVFAGAVAVFALTVGTYIYNPFVVTIFPLVLYYFVYAVCYSLGCLEYAPFCFITPAQRVESVSFSVVLIEIMGLLLLVMPVYLWKMHKDETLV